MTKSRDLGNLAQTVAVNLPTALGTAGQTLVVNSGADGLEFGAASGGSGVTVYTGLSGTDGTPSGATYLLNASSPSAGDLAYVTANTSLYQNNGNGWYRIATINTTPRIDSVEDASSNTTPFTLEGGTNTVITVTATDDDQGTDLTYTHSVTSGSLNGTTVTQGTGANENVFTIVPHASNATTFSITFSVSDSINAATSVAAFTLEFVITDSHYTSLLMATDGSAGDNNDITDSSSNNHTITVTGDAYAGTFSPYRYGGYSAYFDGNDYLSIAHSTDLDLGTGNFTIEGWWRFDDTSNQNLVSKYAANAGFVVQYQSGNLRLVLGLGGSDAVYSFSWTPVAGTWYHVCILRDGTNGKAFINGTQIGPTTTLSTSNVGTTGTLQVGLTHTVSEYTRGYVSDVRIVKGTAITPASGGPTERLTAVTNTKLLTCHLPYFADGSSNGHTITVSGNTSTKPFGPYDYNEYSESTNGGSVYFDGNDDLSATLSSAIGTGDFSISGWYYTGATPTTYHRRIFTIGGNNNANGMSFLHQTSGVLRLRIPANVTETHNYSYKAGQWVYFCIKRSSGTLTLHINGEQEYSGSDSTNLSSTSLCVGNDTIVLTSVYGIDGSVADFKISTSSIEDGSVPTSVVSSSGSILHLKGTDAHVIDKSQGNNLKLVGTAASTSALTSGSTPPYIGAAWAGTSAVSFDGNSDYVIMPQISLGGGDFTIEAYTYLDARLTSYPAIFSNYSSFAAGALGLFAGHGSSTTTNYQVAHNGAGFPAINGGPITYDQWVHLCLERYNGTITLYKDGSSVNSFASTATLNGVGSNFYIGTTGDSISTGYLNGWIQDFRVTVGKARYQGAFTKPGAPLKG